MEKLCLHNNNNFILWNQFCVKEVLFKKVTLCSRAQQYPQETLCTHPEQGVFFLKPIVTLFEQVIIPDLSASFEYVDSLHFSVSHSSGMVDSFTASWYDLAAVRLSVQGTEENHVRCVFLYNQLNRVTVINIFSVTLLVSRS